MQPEFNYLFPRNKPAIRLREVAEKLGLSLDAAWKLYLSGQITGHSHHTDAAAASARGTSRELQYRYTRTVTRESLMAYLARTADYDQEMVLQWGRDIAERLTRHQLLELASYCHHQATHRQ